MKKFAAFIIIAMVLSMSTAALLNVFFAESLPSGENFLDKIENSLSENIPFREKLSGLMDAVRYSSGVRHFDNIYIGNDLGFCGNFNHQLQTAISQAKEYGLLGEDIFGTGFSFDLEFAHFIAQK